MAITRIKIAGPDVLKHFDSLPKRVFSIKEIRSILTAQRGSWRLVQSFRGQDFIRFLQEEGRLIEHDIEFPTGKDVRYAWGQVTEYEIAQSLRDNSFLSHYSAFRIHGVTEQIPKTIYLNKEQGAPFRRGAKLTQQGIDRAFSRKPRTSTKIGTLESHRICMIESMGIEGESIVINDSELGRKLRVTDLERTLIDATVRPFYAGGVNEVLKAYSLAADRISVNRLSALLRRFEYVYPYHQAVGFYLEKSNAYRPEQIDLLRGFPREFDFYLTYQIGEREYSKEWKLFYPKGL